MTLAEKSQAFVRSDPGAARPLGPDRRLAAACSRRCVDQPDPVDRQRRPVDRDVCRGRVLPLQGDRRPCRARECPARHAGDHAARADHRPARLSRRARSSRSERTISRRTASGTTRPTRRGDGKGIPAPTRSSATTSSIRSTIDLVADESEKPALRAALDRITNHILDNNYQLIDVDGTAHALGLVGAGADLGGRGRDRPARAPHAVAPPRRHAHDRRSGAPQEVPGRVRRSDRARHRYHLLTRNQKVMVPGPHQSLGRRAGVPVVLSAAALRDGSARCSPSTRRASSAAGRSSVRSATRCGT